MIRDDENREHTIRLSDEQLAELERISERSEVSHSAELLSGSATQRTIDIQGADHVSAHRHYYTLIDALSAPIRSALNGIATIPTLPDYEELEEIGRGGMGIVYRGRHKKTLRLEAIKVIRTDCMPGSVQHLTRRLRLEAQLAARVAHEHIVPVYQTGEVDGCPWFSMQLVEGTSLRGRLRDSRLPPQQAAMIAEQIARAVNKMHRHGILHGDIKPNNILIERDGGRPLITDFGLADLIETPDADLGIAGTPAYMAPELARAAGQKSTEGSGGLRTVASDVYSLGATLWSSLTGKFPCADGLPLREQLNRVTAGQLRFDEEYPSDVPVELRRICRKCLAEGNRSQTGLP